MSPEGTTRRRFLRATGGAAVGGALLYGSSESAVAQSDEAWPEFRYDNTNTGYAAENTGPVSNIEQRWVVETGDEVWSSPAVVDGTVYVGSDDGNVYALDATDGTEQWRFETIDGVFSSPAVAADTVYVGSDDGNVYALDVMDGTEQWSFSNNYAVSGRMWSSPTVVGGTVYLGSVDGNVYALDATDGTEQWRFETIDEVFSSPAVVDDTLYVGSGDNTVYALDVADGAEQWSFETGDSVHSSPVVVNNTVYTGSYDGNVYALDAEDGTEQWTFETDGDAVWSSPAVVDGAVYVGGEGNVYALDAGEGDEQWRWETGTVYPSPAVVDDTVFIGSYDGNVYALDASIGPDADINPNRERWTIETEDEVFASPAVVNGTVYVGSKDNRIYAFTGDASTPTVTETATATADEPNEPPTASITVTTSEPTAGESITFDASGSTDPDGSVTSYEWEIRVTAGGGGGGVDDSGPTTTASPSSNADSVEAELTVTDDDGATDTTTRRVEFDGGSTDDSGSSVLPLLVGAGTLGAAGGGAWWYRRRDGTDTETGGAQPGGDSGSPPGQPSTATSATTSTSSRGDAESAADSGLLEAVDKLLEEGGTRRDEASDYRAAGEYDRALDIYDEAQEAYEKAIERASESDLIDSDEIEHGLAAVEGARQEVYRQRLQEEVESLRSDLDHADTLADGGDLEKAQTQLKDLDSRLTAAEQTATQRDLDDLQDEIATLERRREERLADITEQLEAHPVPERIPRAPDVSVDSDALTDEEPIGGGGNADVSKATLPTPDGDVTLAIKRPRMSGTLHSDHVERMLQEAETWNKLDDHDHIVGVVDYGSEPLPWIAMEYMDGDHLGERSGEMDLPQALWTALAVTKGVRHAHRRGVAHLDLKPQNVLFRSVEGGWDVPKVADWGLSKHLLEHSKSVEGMSVEYAAPEQFDEDYGTADHITDVYQLGAVFYELFTGRPPFEGQPFKVIDKVKTSQPTPPSEIADVPDAVDEILLTALAKEKADRYDDIVYLRDNLEDLFDDW